MILPTFLQGEVRKFTDTSGREIQAELLAVRGDQVEMNVGGKEFTLSISKFVEADATFIKEWGAANPAPLKIRGLYIKIDKTMDKVDGGGKAPGSETSKINFDYKIAVQNTSTEDLPDMKMKYTIYKLVRERSKGKTSSSSENLEEVSGEESIGTLEKIKTFDLQTKTVMTTDTFSADKKAGTEKRHNETLWGVVVDVYHKDEVIRSMSSPEGLDARVKSYKESQK